MARTQYLVVEVEERPDGRWAAAVPAIPGTLVIGSNRTDSIPLVEAFVLRALAYHLERRKASFSGLAIRIVRHKRSSRRGASKSTRSGPRSAVLGKRAERMVRVTDQACHVLEDLSAALSWLWTRNRALGDKVPASLLATDKGEAEVLEVLGRIEYGIYS